MKVDSVEDVRRLGNFMGAIVLDAESRIAEVNSEMLKILERYPADSLNFATMNGIMKNILPLASTVEMEPIEKNGKTEYPAPDKSCLEDERFLNKISTFTKEEQDIIKEGIRISAKFGPKIRMFKDAQEILLSPATFSDKSSDYATILQDPKDPTKRVFNEIGYENYLLYVQRYAPRQVQNFHMMVDRNTKAVLSHHFYAMSSTAYDRYLETYAENPRMPQKEAEMRKKIKDSMGASILGGFKPLSQVRLPNKQTYQENLQQLTREDRSYHGAASDIGNVLQLSARYAGQKFVEGVKTPLGKKIVAAALVAFLLAGASAKVVSSINFANRYAANPVSISNQLQDHGHLTQGTIDALASNQDLINEIIKQGVNVDGIELSTLRNQLDDSIDLVINDLFNGPIQDYYNSKYQDDKARTVTNVSLFYDFTSREDHRTGLRVQYEDKYGIDHTETMDIKSTPIQDFFVESKGGNAASLSGLLDAEVNLDTTMRNLISTITNPNLSAKERQEAFDTFIEYANTIQGGMRTAGTNTPEVSRGLFGTKVSLDAKEDAQEITTEDEGR